MWLARVTQVLGRGEWRSCQRARKIWDIASGVSETINTTSNIVDKLHSLFFLWAVVVGGWGVGVGGGAESVLHKCCFAVHSIGLQQIVHVTHSPDKLLAQTCVHFTTRKGLQLWHLCI